MLFSFSSVYADVESEVEVMVSEESNIEALDKNYERRAPNPNIEVSNVIENQFVRNNLSEAKGSLDILLTTRASALPTGGGEYPYNPSYWNDASRIDRANCYAYALNVLVSQGPYKLQPGDISGKSIQLTESSIYTAMVADMQKLGRTIRKSYHSEKPGTNEYKIALVIASDDYHYYRQDKDGGFSHKRGLTELIFWDASINSVINPRACDRNYISTGGSNYSTWGNYYIISKP
jgi:hypothetical protein